MTGDVKYAIFEIQNGWVLYFDGDENYFATLDELFEEIKSFEGSDDIEDIVEEEKNEQEG